LTGRLPSTPELEAIQNQQRIDRFNGSIMFWSSGDAWDEELAERYFD